MNTLVLSFSSRKGNRRERILVIVFILILRLRGGADCPPLLFRSDQDCLDILCFHRHRQRCVLAVWKLTGKAERLNCVFRCQFSIEVVFHLWLESESRCRIEADIISPLVFDVIWKLCPLSPWQSCIFRWQGAVFASLFNESLIVIVDTAANDD
jgi:hypothetical protein